MPTSTEYEALGLVSVTQLSVHMILTRGRRSRVKEVQLVLLWLYRHLPELYCFVRQNNITTLLLMDKETPTHELWKSCLSKGLSGMLRGNKVKGHSSLIICSCSPFLPGSVAEDDPYWLAHAHAGMCFLLLLFKTMNSLHSIWILQFNFSGALKAIWVWYLCTISSWLYNEAFLTKYVGSDYLMFFNPLVCRPCRISPYFLYTL